MPTILDIAAGSDDFNILVGAIGFVDSELSAGLATSLGNASADLTVFAPSDAAFTQLAIDLGFSGDTTDEAAITTFIATTLPAELIRDVILYHVSPGSQLLADLSDGTPVNTLFGDVTFTPDGPTLVDNEPDLIDPTLIATDIPADNGIIHVIDRVLIPADLDAFNSDTITGIVAASGGTFDTNGGDFDILLNSVLAAGLDGVLASPEVDLTVFAPTDAAFVGLAQTLGYDGSDEEGAFGYIVEALELLSAGDAIGLLTDVLTYHVAGTSLQSAQVLATDSIPTLQGGDLGVSGTSLVDADPDIADPNLVALDIQASNGIVHVIDGVLLPADLLASDGSGDVDFILDDNSSSRIRTGKDNDLVDGNGGFDTIFSGRGNDIVLGGEQSDFINGGKGSDILRGESGWDVIKGAAGRDIIDGGTGFDLLTGGNGRDVFVFAQGYDRDLVLDFADGVDRIDVSAFGITAFDELEHMIKDGLFSARISFGDGDKLTLAGIEADDLDESDFIFADDPLSV